MSRINLKQIERNIGPLSGRDNYNKEFIFDLLAAYGRSPSNITRLKNGSLNVAEYMTIDVAQKNTVFFRPVTNGESLYTVIDALKSDQAVVRYSTRFVIVTNYKQLLAIDTKTNETLDIPISEIHKYFTFFLPWAGMEKTQYVAENHADIKAAYKMSKLFDEIISYNHHAGNAEYYHGLNVFFSRLLFCFFAEDTGIFEKDQFTRAVGSHTQKDGSDLTEYLDELFFALDAKDKEGYASHIASFPYVNGGLFHIEHKAPKFNTKARELIMECGRLDWSNINPDIFGSMIQAVVNPGQRAGLGMHYTSVPNIMKTIEPLFLDNLKEEFIKNYDDIKKLEKLLARTGNIKIFDPACGSGNFLVIAYKELRKLEHALLERIDELSPHQTNRTMFSRISIENFYGIEIDDFAHEVAILSLWLAKHQMNLEFQQKFGIEIPLIPLRESANIVQGNAARLDWNKVCPNEPHKSRYTSLQQGKLIADENEQTKLLEINEKEWDEIYLIGNPPYLGGKSIKMQSQKDDVRIAFSDLVYSKNVDYISIWFIKGARYISGSQARLAFVSTNSICQGEQVSMLWPYIFDMNLEIQFAYTSFKWENSAKNKAGVTCVIVGVGSIKDRIEKRLYTNGIATHVKNINAYLSSNRSNIIIAKRQKAISEIPHIALGSMPKDGGHLLLSRAERNELLSESPWAEKFIKRFIGSADLIRGIERYCLWINDQDIQEAISSPFIKRHVEAVAKFRANSDASSTREFALKPHRFVQISYQEKNAILIPLVSSERREYIPMGYVDRNTVISSLSFGVYDATLDLFGILTSKMSMVWVAAVGGKMKTDYRYSAVIVYNNFPVPILNAVEKQNIEAKAYSVLDSREHHSEQTLAELYDPDKMPDDLRSAHQALDEVVESMYRKKPFENDEERLSHLFDLYEQMIEREKDRILV